jgi:phosphatidylinositol alpha-1,6-mannosyltransferase
LVCQHGRVPSSWQARHLLVTNDFPPKVGGIQSYLWELWRRLDPERFVVLTASSDPGAVEFDRQAATLGIRILRAPNRVLLPTPGTARLVRSVARAAGARAVVLDPALPLGLLGPGLGLPYAVVLHGAEVTVPARLPGTRNLLRQVLCRASLVVAAGGYPVAEARRVGDCLPPVVQVPPGVDLGRFRPLASEQRRHARAAFGAGPGPLVVSVSRLVPRKGMDVLVEASARLAPEFPGLQVLIAGEGRDRRRLEALVRRRGAPVRLLGRVPDDQLPGLYGAADVFCMACRDRWGGLEQEGFGIVFLEAAACGVPQVAGRSGGAAEAVVSGETGWVVEHPQDPGALAAALRCVLADQDRARAMGRAARRRAEQIADYDLLARRLGAALDWLGGPGSAEPGQLEPGSGPVAPGRGQGPTSGV